MFKKKVFIDENNVAVLSRNVFYLRKEKDDFYSINDPSTKYPNYKMLNSSAAFVMSQIDGKKTVEQITRMLMDNYKISFEEYELILEDVKSIMENFQESRIIDWKNEVNFVEKSIEIRGDYVISVAKEEELREIKQYLDKNLNLEEQEHSASIRYISPILRNRIKDKNLVSFTMLRQMIFLYEYILLLKREKDTNAVVGFVTYTISKDFPQTLQLEYLFNTEGDILDFFDKNVVNKIKRMAVEDVRKVRLFANSEDEIGEALLKGQFKKIAALERELGSSDLCIYDMKI